MLASLGETERAKEWVVRGRLLDPGNASLHQAVLAEALELLASASRGEVRTSRNLWRRAGDVLPAT